MCDMIYMYIYSYIYIYINIYNIYTYLDASTELDLSPAHIQLVLAEWSPYLQRLSILCHCRSPIPSYRLLLSCNWDTPGNPQVFQQFTTFPGICWLEMIHVVPLAWPAMYLRIEPHRLWSRPWRRHHPPIGFQIYMKCPGANIRLVLVGRPSHVTRIVTVDWYQGMQHFTCMGIFGETMPEDHKSFSEPNRSSRMSILGDHAC